MDSDAGVWGSGTAVVIWRFYESIRVVVWVGALRLVSVTEGVLPWRFVAMRLIHGVYVNMSPRMAVMVSGKVSSGLL